MARLQLQKTFYHKLRMKVFASPLPQAFTDYRKDSSVAVSKTDRYVENGRKRPRKTKKGWQLKVKWSDGSISWLDLKALKEWNPVDVVEFSIARGIFDDEPAFSWWVPDTMRKRQAIISAIKVSARKVSHKHGIEIPKNVHHAKDLDARNGNRLWQIALEKEIYELGRGIEVKDESVTRPPPGWSLVLSLIHI